MFGRIESGKWRNRRINRTNEAAVSKRNAQANDGGMERGNITGGIEKSRKKKKR